MSTPASNSDLYDSDFYAWTNRQAALMRSGQLEQAREDAYGDAILDAASETGLAEDSFPARCPFTGKQTHDEGWWPS